MKNLKYTVLIISLVFLSLTLGTCDNVISLGERINFVGPEIQIDRPLSREAVDGLFVMSGSVDAFGNTDIDHVLINAFYTERNPLGGFMDIKFPMEWRYYMGQWEESMDDGLTWTAISPSLIDTASVEAVWLQTEKHADWRLPIDMKKMGAGLVSTEYRLRATAWDTVGNSDSNSSKTRTVIVDKDPPLVSIINPWPYPEADWHDPATELNELHILDGTGNTEYRETKYLGKFLNDEFILQWEIVKELSDIWAVELCFYDYDIHGYDWDNALYENDYIYRTYINDVRSKAPITNPNSINPNYKFTVPDLSGSAFAERLVENGRIEELKNPVTGKKTIVVTARCTDMANNELQEKLMGYLIYWPASDKPWITFPDSVVDEIIDINTSVYPSFWLPCRANDDDGVDRVEYQIYREDGGNLELLDDYITPKVIKNTNNTTIQSWEFNPPPTSGIYYIEARVFDINATVYETDGTIREIIPEKTETASGYFRVQDISYPEIRPPKTPIASEPLFKFIQGSTIDDWYIDIAGEATTASSLASVSIVWINPHSANYAAMSQLAYFRDPLYQGWSLAPDNYYDPPVPDTEYDFTYPNYIWTMKLEKSPQNDPTGRLLYNYSKTLSLKDDLKIDPVIAGDPESLYNYLKSQVFLLKATDYDDPPKSSIITWAPQGDAEAPKVKITDVQILRAGQQDPEDLEPGKYHEPIDQFSQDDKIIINGTWEEDSAEYLLISETLEKNFVVAINGNPTDPDKYFSLSLDQASPQSKTGTWTAVGTVRSLGYTNDVINYDDGSYILVSEYLKDTLVISVTVIDSGGNVSEDGASWLIRSDELRLLRVGSDTLDGTYTYGTSLNPVEIDIFLEFNKPVILKNPGTPPILTLNTTSGEDGIAVYNFSHADHTKNLGGASTKQHFTYTVKELQLADILTVNGLYGGDSNYDEKSGPYPFAWLSGSEEIRLVTSEKDPVTNVKISGLPVTSNSTDETYLYTLMAGKQIKIDTSPPVLSGTTPVKASNKPGWYTIDSYLYITLDFNKAVQPDGARLKLNIDNKDENGVTVRTGAYTDEVQVNGNSLIFRYTILPGDLTNGYSVLSITGLDGSIKDLAGNTYNSSALPRNLSGIYVDAIKPKPPTVKVMSDTSNVISNNSGTGQTNTGVTSPWNPRDFDNTEDFIENYDGAERIDLENIYNEKVYIQILPEGTVNNDYSRILYSINYGRDWAEYDFSSPNNPKLQIDQGYYAITARQIDMAGNVSDWTIPISLNWDSGGLLTLVTSPDPNGTYTNNGQGSAGREDVIRITFNFRIPIIITEDPVITLSVIDEAKSGLDKRVVFSQPKPTGAVSSFTFYYETGVNDTTNDEILAVESCVFEATDEAGVDVDYLLNLDLVNMTGNNLQDKKKIYVINGIPELSGNPELFKDTSASLFQGINDDDDSYWMTLRLKFTRDIYRGDSSKTIRVIQAADGYRLPSVLNLSQRARYKPVIDALFGEGTFDSYYEAGTNGYDPVNNSPDTQTKYILKFEYDTYEIAPDAGGSDIEKLAEAFRQAEKTELPINSSFITISGKEVLVRLTGSNALKVPGAKYEIEYDTGLVIDILGSSCPEYKNKPASQLDGVSKPSIRIQKSQDIVKLNPAGPSANNPRFTVTPPGTAKVRLDSRTPNSRVSYLTASSTPGDGSVDWHTNFGKNPPVLNTPTANPGISGDPTSGTNIFGRTDLGAFTPLEIGPGPETSGIYQGFKWRIKAAGMTGTGASAVYSTKFAEEMAFRTVIVFAGSSVTGVNGRTFASGDMLWIRGGNTKTATTIPGFPLTPADNWSTLGDKRAGIRPFSKVSGTALASSTWQWVTWDMNAVAYFNLYLGHDDVSDEDEIFHYGPLQAAVHIGNWTNLIEYYCAFPGERRWLANGTPSYTDGGGRAIAYTFNSTWDIRPEL